MEFKGSFRVDTTESEAKRYFQDISKVVKCLPYLEEFKINNNDIESTFKIDIRDAGIPHMSTLTVNYNAKVIYTENGIMVQGVGKSAGVKIKINITLNVIGKDKGSEIEWNAIIDLGLLAKLLGEKLIESIATKNIKLITSCISKNLNK